MCKQEPREDGMCRTESESLYMLSTACARQSHKQNAACLWVFVFLVGTHQQMNGCTVQ